jgi:hypothetical protein
MLKDIKGDNTVASTDQLGEQVETLNSSITNVNNTLTG